MKHDTSGRWIERSALAFAATAACLVPVSPVPAGVSLQTESPTVATPEPAPAAGDWYVIAADRAEVRSAAPGVAGSYVVRELQRGTAVLVVDFVDGAARVALVDRLGDVAGILEIGDAVEVRGNTAHVVAATEMRTPSAAGRGPDGRPDPLRAYQTMLELEGGESFAVLDRFSASGRDWALVRPGEATTLYVAGDVIRPATREEIARPTKAAASNPPVPAPTIAPVDATVDATVVFPDGVTGTWMVVRDDGRSIRTGPDTQNAYAVARLARGDLVPVVETTSDGWCRVRYLGPALEGVRSLLAAEPGAIESADGVATIRRGHHDVRAASLVGRTDTGDPDPEASYLPTARVGPGETLTITRRFTDHDGDHWFEVVPPLASEGWIHGGYLVDATSDAIPVAHGLDDGGRPRFVVGPIEPALGAADPASDPVDDGQPALAADPPAMDPEDSGDPEVDLIVEASEIPDPPTDEAEIVVEIPPDLAQVSFEDAEATYDLIRRDPRNEAEFEAMATVYRAIAARPTALDAERQRAEVRLQQIEIQREVQRRIDALKRIEDRTNLDRERIESIRQALLDRADYTAIGRLSRSRIYDGRRLPRLYRLEDPISGRTTAYVLPNEALSIDSGVGRIVGIVGTEREDPGYRIRVIRPERFEIDLTEEIAER